MSQEICKEYLDALNQNDLEKVLSLFTENAVIVSPLYGETAAASFFKDLFADTERSETKLLNIFDSSDKGDSMGLHFHYTWTLQSGEVVKFEVVDIFDLSDDRRHFKKLTIIYDTYRIRDEHAYSKSLKKQKLTKPCIDQLTPIYAADIPI